MTDQPDPEGETLDTVEPQHDRPAEEEDSALFAWLRRRVKEDNRRVAEHGSIGRWL
ncbi:hypothetical protein J7E99_11855 [Streptomyces sp. ISL-44]|uniref:hypothetical protein n=1 Tax=Streptomyces sp. ISL-44 TaxID=2819184 RepID=UPI001BE83C47|nr:hypothetical protein [Streptomyces sp. ISL-44]MBT2541385.1 hypothetical protein [Streptomyces sp. ISL-44]